jgi:hypothetical protein
MAIKKADDLSNCLTFGVTLLQLMGFLAIVGIVLECIVKWVL